MKLLINNRQLFGRVYFIFFIVLCFAFSANGLRAQSQISGRIVSETSKENIPFVHVFIESQQRTGTVSNIEGYYTLKVPTGINPTDTVSFSCIGYKPRHVTISELIQNPNLTMLPATQSLTEVVIKAREDPAYALMQKVIENRDRNNPESLPHFKFTAYNKANIDVARTDSIQADLAKTGFENAHFMMLESATEVIYQKPGKWNEKVIADKISGIKNPAISLVSNSFQPFTCYNNYLNISGFNYLNPISTNSRARYTFTLRDSAYVEGEKVYIIQFNPRKNAAEELLDGNLTILANSYALVNFHARNSGEYALMYFEIRQAYTQVDTHWFPNESNTTYTLPNEDSVDLIASSTTFIRDIKLDYVPKKGDFGIADIQRSASANAYPDSAWNYLRDKPLTLEESNTYAVYDTLPKNIINSMNWMMDQSVSIIRGRLNFGKVDVLLNHLFGFNQYEGFRLGAGLATSDKLIKWMSVEGYAAYGFKDEGWKYGGGLRFFILPERDVELRLYYRSDLREPGRDRFTKDIGFLNNGEVIRNLFARRMDEVERYESALTWRPARGLRTKISFDYENLRIQNQDYFDQPFENPTSIISAQFGLELRYAPGESLMQTGNAFTPLNVSFPRFRFLINHSAPGIIESNTEFTKAQIEFEHEFKLRGIGTTRIFGNAAKVWGDDIAYPHLYYGRGGAGKSDVGVLSSGYFQTMDLYAFLSDQYIQGGIVHNFGSIFGIKKSFSKPELKLAYSAAIGSLSKENTQNVPFEFRTMTKPYLEGGIMIDNILRLSSSFYYSGYGIGVFYNHGAYEMPKFGDNLSFIVTFAISL